jgi:hypothetical protein
VAACVEPPESSFSHAAGLSRRGGGGLGALSLILARDVETEIESSVPHAGIQPGFGR